MCLPLPARRRPARSLSRPIRWDGRARRVRVGVGTHARGEARQGVADGRPVVLAGGRGRGDPAKTAGSPSAGPASRRRGATRPHPRTPQRPLGSPRNPGGRLGTRRASVRRPRKAAVASSGRRPMLDTEPAGGVHTLEASPGPKGSAGGVVGATRPPGAGPPSRPFCWCVVHSIKSSPTDIHSRPIESRRPASGRQVLQQPLARTDTLDISIQPRATSCTRPLTVRGRPGRTAAALPPSPLKLAVFLTAGLMGRY